VVLVQILPAAVTVISLSLTANAIPTELIAREAKRDITIDKDNTIRDFIFTLNEGHRLFVFFKIVLYNFYNKILY
jgi:hypothetical protein